jgi:AcrR family transcriptional regulator
MAIKEVNAAAAPMLYSKLAPEDAAGTAGQIVEAFARRAKDVGIRSISMGELARELRVSTKTLYKYFRNKEDLVYELVVRWENRIHKPLSSYEGSLLDILRYWVKVWVENDAQFSTAFWQDLQSDYPQLYKVYVDSLYSRMAVMRARVTPFLKPEINPDFAWSTYFILMTASAKPKTFEKLGMTRDQSVYAAFDFWVNAALDKERIMREAPSLSKKAQRTSARR